MFIVKVFGAIIFLIILRIYLHFKNKYRYWQNRGIKVIQPAVFPLGNFWSIFKWDVGIGEVLKEWYNSVDTEAVGLYAIDEPILLVRDPDIIRDIMVKDFNSFSERGLFMDKNDCMTGQLWKLPTHKWKPLRTKMSTCFTIGKLKMMFFNLLNAGTEMESYLETVSGAKSIDMDDVCKRFAADVIAHSIFGLNVNSFKDDQNDFLKMSKRIMTFSKRTKISAALQSLAPNLLEWFSFIKLETVNKIVLAFMYQVVDTVITFREKTGTVGKDMMQLLIQLKNYGKVEGDNGEKIISDGTDTCLSMNEVVAQAYTYFFTGGETASSTLIMLLHECALNEEIQKRVHQDIDAALVLSNGKVTYEAILGMKYLNMVVSETLRKFPILSFLLRKAVEDYRIEKLNLEIKKGQRVYFSLNGLHMDPKHYPDPEKFDPERFSKENQAARHPMTYMPFGHGPRNCIGMRLGYFMVAVGAVHIFRKFHVRLSEDSERTVKLNPLSFTMRPANAVFLKVTPR